MMETWTQSVQVEIRVLPHKRLAGIRVRVAPKCEKWAGP